jgi:hypothetical protein
MSFSFKWEMKKLIIGSNTQARTSCWKSRAEATHQSCPGVAEGPEVRLQTLMQIMITRNECRCSFRKAGMGRRL